MSRAIDVKAELMQSLKYLHLPTVRQCYEEVAQQAERESLKGEPATVTLYQNAENGFNVCLECAVKAVERNER